jgi:uncharacterized protein
VLRDVLAAIENAEAPPMPNSPAADNGVFAGSVPGLGATEVPRVLLNPAAVTAIIGSEIRERREAADDYRRLGRHTEASVLLSQVEVLVSLKRETA